MKAFLAPYISADILCNGLGQLAVSSFFGGKQKIDNLLWSNNGYKPEVAFNMAYSNASILLRYVVKEKYFSAIYREINAPVYKDSCVELFIAFNNESEYYNLEFNGLGTSLVGYGAGRNDRVDVDKYLVESIERHSIIKATGNNNEGPFEWELTLNIPFSIFKHHHITSLNNQICKVNFYKCGDDLPEPHFLSWNKIIYPSPNFHLPEFFGVVQFMSQILN